MTIHLWRTTPLRLRDWVVDLFYPFLDFSSSGWFGSTVEARGDRSWYLGWRLRCWPRSVVRALFNGVKVMLSFSMCYMLDGATNHGHFASMWELMASCFRLIIIPFRHFWCGSNGNMFSGSDNFFDKSPGGASSSEALAVCMLPLSLTGTIFSWFASLAPSSINSWYDLEKKVSWTLLNVGFRTRKSHSPVCSG